MGSEDGAVTAWFWGVGEEKRNYVTSALISAASQPRYKTFHNRSCYVLHPGLKIIMAIKDYRNVLLSEKLGHVTADSLVWFFLLLEKCKRVRVMA